MDGVDLELDERKQFHGSAYVKFRRPGACASCASRVEYASRAAMKMDGIDVLDRKISVTIPQRRGKGWRLEDEEQSENIALDPQRRSLIMRHLAESKKDEDLNRMIQQVNNPGQVAANVGTIDGGEA